MTKATAVETNGTKLVKLGMKDLKIKGSAWATAGEMIVDANVFEGTTQKEQSAIFADHWSKEIDRSILPAKPKNRQGKTIDLIHDDGSLKLSQWDCTAPGMKAMNEITKLTRTYAEMVPEGSDEPRGMETAIADFFPKGKVISGRKMRELIGKVEKDALAIIERCIDQIEKALPKVPSDDFTRIEAVYHRAVAAFSAVAFKKAA